jgi:VanZ family protein
MAEMSESRTRAPRFITVSLPLYLWAAAILAVSSLPGQKLPQIGFWQWDKLAHVLEFAVFAYLLYRYLLLRHCLAPERIWRICLVVGVLYGVVDELHQLLIPLRMCTWQDLAADSSGVALGIVAGAKHLLKREAT